jgi:hypothetical protein
MNLITKLAASSGVILGANAITNSLLKGVKEPFTITCMTSVAPICVALIDKFINQNVTGSFVIQSILTGIETTVGSLINLGLLGKNHLDHSSFVKYAKPLLDGSLDDGGSINVKAVTINSLVQAFGLKLIWQDWSESLDHENVSDNTCEVAIMSSFS